MKYRSKVVEIEARELTQWNDQAIDDWIPGGYESYANEVMEIRTANGIVEAVTGDFIILEPSGNGAYPCKPEVFHAKYEAIEASPVTPLER